MRFQGLNTSAVRDDKGATAVEYAMIIALVAVVISIAVLFVGRSSASAFTGAGNAIGGATPEPAVSAQAPAASPQAPAPYAGPTPAASYGPISLGNAGTYSLPAIAGISYVRTGCSGSVSDGCDADKVSLSATTLRVDREWSKEHRAATMSIMWTIPASETTQAASGVVTVSLR